MPAYEDVIKSLHAANSTALALTYETKGRMGRIASAVSGYLDPETKPTPSKVSAPRYTETWKPAKGKRPAGWKAGPTRRTVTPEQPGKPFSIGRAVATGAKRFEHAYRHYTRHPTGRRRRR